MGQGSWVDDRVDELKGTVGPVARAVVAPVAGADTGDKAGAVGSAVLGAARRHLSALAAPDGPMPGGTNWNAYSHEELHAMVHNGANHGQVGGLAGDWQQAGDRLAQNADQLTRLVDALRAHWSGEAADRAAASLREQGRLLGQVGSWIDTVHRAVSDAGEALRVAQQTMPEPLGPMPTPPVAGGPLGMALGAVGGATDSRLAEMAAREELKAQAVQVMQTYEASLGAATVGPPPPATSGRAGGAAPASGGGAPAAVGPWQVLIGRGSTPGLFTASAGAPAREPATAVPVPAAARSEPGRTKLPTDDKLFTVDRTPPPVIGA